MDLPSEALQQRSPEMLRDGLLQLLREGEDEWIKDDRDLMLAIAPFHDCARRLGLEVSEFFSEVAVEGPPRLRATVEQFGRRTDITPEGWLFRVEEREGELRYRNEPL